MSWKKLDDGTARYRFGFANSEDAIQTICAECPKANLDFSEEDFCQIQAEYGFDGEHEKIQYTGDEIRCLGYESIKAEAEADERWWNNDRQPNDRAAHI